MSISSEIGLIGNASLRLKWHCLARVEIGLARVEIGNQTCPTLFQDPLGNSPIEGLVLPPRKKVGLVNRGFFGRLPRTRRCPMHQKYLVRLSDEERGVCQAVVKKPKGSAEKVRRAQILLKADADGPAWIDVRIAEAFDCRVQTVESLRKRLVTQGFEQALERKRRETSPTPRKLDGVGEAKLIAMRLGKPPAGYGRWSLQLLADELVVLEVVDSICPETVRKTLKKTG